MSPTDSDEQFEYFSGLAIYELSDQDFNKLCPVGGGSPEIVVKTKEPISIRLSKEAADYFRASSKGRQTRIDNVLRDYQAHAEK